MCFIVTMTFFRRRYFVVDDQAKGGKDAINPKKFLEKCFANWLGWALGVGRCHAHPDKKIVIAATPTARLVEIA